MKLIANVRMVLNYSDDKVPEAIDAVKEAGFSFIDVKRDLCEEIKDAFDKQYKADYEDVKSEITVAVWSEGGSELEAEEEAPTANAGTTEAS